MRMQRNQLAVIYVINFAHCFELNNNIIGNKLLVFWELGTVYTTPYSTTKFL